jgi:hypothetical protein
VATVILSDAIVILSDAIVILSEAKEPKRRYASFASLRMTRFAKDDPNA